MVAMRNTARRPPCSSAKNDPGTHVYLQIVENRWEKGRSKQRVIATVGRLDELQQSGQLDGLLQSGAKFAEAVMVLSAHRRGDVPAIRNSRIGPALIFGRLWDELQIPQVIQRLLAGRRFGIPLERMLFLTVLASLVRLRQRSLLRAELARALRHPGDRSRESASRLSRHGMAGRTFARRTAGRGHALCRALQRRMLSRRPSSSAAAICSATWTWCSSTPRRSTSRGRAARNWASTGTAKTIARTASRWSWA